MIAEIPTEIQTEHLPATSQDSCHYANLLRKYVCMTTSRMEQTGKRTHSTAILERPPFLPAAAATSAAILERFQRFMQSEVSLPCTQESSTGPYPALGQYIPPHPI
jgi:hypothetical protein